jgi:hypothetical protein
MKDILDTCDGVLMSLIFSFPEMFLDSGYSLTDRITNSIIMNCFHNYSRFQRNLKLFRKTVKHAGLNQIELNLSESFLRDMSYFAAPADYLSKTAARTSKEKMFRVAMLCQTRASGLAGVGQVKESIDKFLSTVTVERDYNPSPLLSECIEEVTSHLAGIIRYGPNAEFKISMSTSACRESGQRTEGKFGFLKNLVRDSEVVIPPLREGVPGTLGNWIWREASIKMADGDPDIMNVNVAAIRENAKSRIVTSGSFWKDAALQPFSHLTINIAKNLPSLRNSLQAARHGWKFIESIKQTYKDNDSPFVFEGDLVKLYTSDMSRATDLPTPKMGWDLTGRLLTKLGFEPEVLETVKKYWLGPKNLFIGGKPVGKLVNGIPMGDPLTKTNLSLTHPVCDLYARKSLGCLSRGVGNGDDICALSDSELYASKFREGCEQLGYEFDELDECNSSTWGTYCEEWFHVPVGRPNTCHHAMKHGKSALLPYLDTVKIRVCIATTKDRMDFSSDPRGKVSLLGHDQEYARKMDGPAETIFSIASAFQDVALATIDRREPLFLPRQVAGVGKPPPHWNVGSWKNIMKRCAPWHREYYLTMMKEMCDGTVGISGYRGALKESNHFSKEMLVELYQIPADDPIRSELLVSHDKWHLFPGNVLTKLINLGYLITESKLTKYYLFQERLEQLEQNTNRDLFEVVKSKMIGTEYNEEEEDLLITRFRNVFKDSPYRLSMDRTENLYNITAVLKLEEGNPLYVDLPPSIQRKFGSLPRPHTRYEEAGEELYEWFLGNGLAILDGEEHELPPVDIIEDDPIIIQHVLNGGADIFFIVTDDIKLYRLAANKSLAPVGLIAPRDFLSVILWDGRESQEAVEYWINKAMGEDTWGEPSCRLLVDQGSLNSYLEKYHQDESGAYATDGIPWRKDIKKSNMQRTPGRGTLQEVQKKSFRDLGYPRKAFPWGYPDLFKKR